MAKRADLWRLTVADLIDEVGKVTKELDVRTLGNVRLNEAHLNSLALSIGRIESVTLRHEEAVCQAFRDRLVKTFPSDTGLGE